MEEYAERLNDLCTLHGVVPPKNFLGFKSHEFGVDAKEVDEILTKYYDLYDFALDCEELE